MDYRITYETILFSQPYYGKAIKPVGKANEEKITNALNKLLEEDKTLNLKTIQNKTAMYLWYWR